MRILEKTGALHGSEIFYSEFNASPVPTKPPAKGEKDPSSAYLDDYIYKNALEQTGDSAIIGMAQGLVGMIKPMLQPGNVFKLLFFGAMIYQLIIGALYG